MLTAQEQRDHDAYEQSSLVAAEAFVREALTRETLDCALRDGEEISVDNLQDCDCVPLRIDDFDQNIGVHGYWKLESCRTKRPGLFSVGGKESLLAVYRFSKR